MAVAADDDVVVQCDRKRGGGFLDVLRYRDIGKAAPIMLAKSLALSLASLAIAGGAAARIIR